MMKFQFQTGSIKSEQQALKMVIRFKFQFQTGSIKSSFLHLL